MSMRPTSVTVVGAATSVPIPLNYHSTPFNVTLQVSVVSGVIDATVQYTNDDIRAEGWTPAGGNWFNHVDLTNVAALSDGTLISPVSAIRLVNAAAGTAKLDIRSAG